MGEERGNPKRSSKRKEKFQKGNTLEERREDFQNYRKKSAW